MEICGSNEMNKFKGTKGTWLRDGRTVYALQPSHAPRLSEMENRFSAGFYAGYGCPDEEVQANAQLAMSAPDLLEALTALWSAIENWEDASYCSRYGLVNQARTAIAKALGDI